LQIELNTYNKYRPPTSLVALPISQPSLNISPSQKITTRPFRIYGEVTFLCWYYTGASFKYWFYFLLGPVWYLESFVSLNFIFRYSFVHVHLCAHMRLCLISDFKGQYTVSYNDFIIFALELDYSIGMCFSSTLILWTLAPKLSMAIGVQGIVYVGFCNVCLSLH
jgi:hypothetical protein